MPETSQVEQISVRLRRSQLRGWTSFQINRTLDTAAASFEVEAVLRRPSLIKPSDDIEIRIGQDTLVAGRVDSVARRLERDGLHLVITGRDRSADLVDCSATNSPGEWSRISLEDLIRNLAGPFNVPLEYKALRNPVIDLFKLRKSETAWSAIERACRQSGILIWAARGTGATRLTADEPGRDYARADLIEGQNVIEAEFIADDSDRYRTYLVHGQHPGSDAGSGDWSAIVEGKAIDLGGRDGRVLVIVAESSVTGQTAEERAQWEAIVRAARAVRLRVLVSGIRQLPGDVVWDLNQKVICKLPSLNCDQFLLLRGISITGSREGVHTTLELCRADAYRPNPSLAAEDDPSWEFLDEADEADREPNDE